MILTHGANSIERGGDITSVEIGGKTYQVVRIGDQYWLAQNLDYLYSGLLVNQAGIPTNPAGWYQSDSYRQDYGVLYNFAAVEYLNDHLQELDIPSGWKVASKTDYQMLFTTVGGLSNTPNVLRDSSWGGNDQYGFTAKPGGYYFNGSYSTIGTYAWFWTSTKDNANAYKYLLGSDAYLEPDDVNDAFSIRLVKDAT